MSRKPRAFGWETRRREAAFEVNLAIERARALSARAQKALYTRRQRELEESKFEEGAEWIVEEPFDEFGGEKYQHSHIMFQPEDMEIQKPKPKPKPVKPAPAPVIPPFTFAFLNRWSKELFGRALTSLLHSEIRALAKYIVGMERGAS